MHPIALPCLHIAGCRETWKPAAGTWKIEHARTRGHQRQLLSNGRDGGLGKQTVLLPPRLTTQERLRRAHAQHKCRFPSWF